MASALDGLYWEFSIPLGLKQILENVIAVQQNSPNTPEVQQSRAPREWYSQARIGNDLTVEVMQINFRSPVGVAEIGFQAVRVPAHIEIWYQDRNQNWLPMRDESFNPVTVDLGFSAAISWYTAHFYIYPIVCTGIQFRMVRKYDAQMGNNPYVIGLRETLIRRNVYTRQQGTQAFEDMQDELGNTISAYIQDWDARNAIDNDPTTYWKSFPIPDPLGVACLYLDMRDSDGSAQLVDTVYIDPVFTGQVLNLYYSTDDTQGRLNLSPVSLSPDSTHNTNWTLSKGLVDASTLGTSNSSWQAPAAWGPLVGDPLWIGIEWTPDFDAGSPPPDNPILFGVTPPSGYDGSQYWPTVYYDVGAGYITLELNNGTTTHSYYVALSPVIAKAVPLDIVVGWNYAPDTVFISVQTKAGVSLGTTTATPTGFPSQITLDGEVGFTNFRGLMTALVVKQEPWTSGLAGFLASAINYVNPDPVQPSLDGTIPSTTLDNAILACDWTSQALPTGGSHESVYESKTWTPIWSNYITKKGKLFLPQVLSMKYLKLEFTNLTAEPYPVFDSGIQVSYETFPLSVTSTATGGPQSPAGLLTLTAEIPSRAFGVNWLNPSTVQSAVNAAYGQTQQPVTVIAGPGVVTGSLPNTAQSAIASMYRSEQTSPWVYRRTLLNPSLLAGQTINVINGTASHQTLISASETAATPTPIGSNFSPTIMTSQSNLLPVQGKDWWLFPGRNLKMPATVMEGLTGLSQVTTARGPSSVYRPRFMTAQVHKYNTKTITLDAAISYFAGVREVQAYRTTYVATEDPAVFRYSQYDPNQFVYTNIVQMPTGPVTVKIPYVLDNPDFDLDLSGWTLSGDWTWDGVNGIRINEGNSACAAVEANATLETALSGPVAVSPGDQIIVSAWVRYSNVASVPPGTITDNSDGTATEAGGVVFAELFTDDFDGTAQITGGTDNGDGTLVSVDALDSGDGSTLIPGDPGGTTESGAEDRLDGTAVPEQSLTDRLDGTATIPAGVGHIADGIAILDVLFATDRTDGTAVMSGVVLEEGELSISGVTYLAGVEVSPVDFGVPAYGHGPTYYQPVGSTDGYIYYQLKGLYTVPTTGVDSLAVSLNVNGGITSGTVYWADVSIDPASGEEGTVYADIVTTSNFAKLNCVFNDSGVVRSDGMWAREDPLDTNINNTQLAYYTETIPNNIPTGNWSDDFAEWDDPAIEWGEPHSEVSITVDPVRIFEGNRVVHFSRGVGTQEAGLLVVQQTNFYPKALFRLCCTFFKPNANANQIILRLRRISDGVYVHVETFNPVVGYWYTFQSPFLEVPDSTDQAYTIEMVSSGDQADEVYVSDIYTEIAGVRYFVRLGGADQFLHDVTPLAYGGSQCQVSATLPVNEFSVTTAIFSPRSFAYGWQITPQYLK